jgi:cellobiose phosphorylase
VNAGAGFRRLASPSGLAVQVNANGAIRRIDHGDVVVNLFPGSEAEGGPANVWLRRRGDGIAAVPLLGPRSPGAVAIAGDRLVVRGRWRDLDFVLQLLLAQSAPAWFWHLRVENRGAAPVMVDAVHAQDLALAPYAAIRMNEYYVSQYVDYTPLVDAAHGYVLAVRQNLAMGGRHPWALVGALGRAIGFATDALQLHGLATRAGDAPEALAAPTLPVVRRQHEHSLAALQEEPFTLAPGAAAARGFFVWLDPDHAAVTGDADLAAVARVLALPEAAAPADGAKGAMPAAAAAGSLFARAPLLAGDDLDPAALDAHFGGERRHVETDAEGRPLSFFTGAHCHVVLRAKERRVLRPHGSILRTGDALVPDEAALTSTVWMDGVFHSLVTQGHVNINRVLSTARSYLGLFRAHGLRIFVDADGDWRLLGVPSAFAMTPGGARWIYRFPGGCVAVAGSAATTRHELGLAVEVLAGPPRRFLFSAHVALGGDDGADPAAVRWERDAVGIVVRTDPDAESGRRFPQGFVRLDPLDGTVLARVAGDEALYADGRSRGEPFLVVETAPAARAAFRLTAALTVAAPAAAAPGADDAAAEARFWTGAAGGIALQAPAAAPEAARVAEILPWYAHDALVHYLAPRGLEQYSGGGWGTRDVCQGPVEYLLALGRHEPLRDLLQLVFAAQNPDGDWPQWFMFFPRDRNIRPDDSHGDIVFWPLLALAQYLLASEDFELLHASVPFFHSDGDAAAERAMIGAHVGRALAVIEARQIPTTSLVAYGHGDWNDSLQPADPAMRERLCSAWTVTLQVQTARALAQALRRAGWDALGVRCEALAERTRADFQRLLLPGGVLAGFAYFHAERPIQYLLHPSDDATGIHYRLLPMIHAISNGLLTPQEARRHLDLMREHLLAPDGARLFDRPPRYRGGEQRYFQRAESSSFFGRENGLMYTHAHLRYAEAMATLGEAEAFWLALLQAVPIGLGDVVPNARPRQANTYTSSSDPVVADRYEAEARYGDVRAGRVPVEGGWRIYSSGAGIAFRLIHERLLGIRRRRSTLAFDPVLPRRLDGLVLDLVLVDRPVRVRYAVGARGVGVGALTVNGAALAFEREPNPYRPGAALVATTALAAALRSDANELVISLG